MSKKYGEELEFFDAITVTTRDYAVTTINSMEIVEVFGDGSIRVKPTGEIRAVGTARKDPLDKFRAETGRKLSLGRAFANLGNKITKQGDGLVKHADDITAMKIKQKARKKAVKEVSAAAAPKVLPTAVTSTPSTAASISAKKKPKTRVVVQRTTVNG